ncbi:hypothetical protein EV182_005973, partial [Spiromyces aspiralis]
VAIDDVGGVPVLPRTLLRLVVDGEGGDDIEKSKLTGSGELSRRDISPCSAEVLICENNSGSAFVVMLSPFDTAAATDEEIVDGIPAM